MKVFYKTTRRAILGCVFFTIILSVVAAIYLESTLPAVEMIKDLRQQVPLRVYSNDGKLIAEFGEARRSPVHLDQVPKELIHAVLATEDRRFYEHAGVDLRGIIRAAFNLLTNVSVKQGGSTITMQVARNYFLTRKKTIVRKISEILLALKIEKEFSKDEILELYLNKIYFGKRAYGVQAAAEVYYGTTVDKLSLDQIAMIAGLPQAPSSINPLHDKVAAYKRRKHVLERMLSYGFITQAQYDEAIDAPLPTRFHGRTIEVDAPYVAEMVRQDLFNRYGEAIYTLGYEVYTTIDSQQQLAANRALRRGLMEYDQRHGYRKSKIRFNVDRSKKPEEMVEEWHQQLEDIPVLGELMPGVVTRVDNNELSVLLQNESYIKIPWSGMAWTRLRTPKEVASVGQVIYVQEISHPDGPDTYKLAQIPEASASFVSLEPETGAILSLIGGFDYNLSNFNRSVQAERQPGSGFKPFIYAAALAEGYTLASVINDAPLVYVDPVSGAVWQPHNATNKFYGPTRLRVSLKKSQNMVTVRLFQAIGIKNAIDYLERFGFNRAKLPVFLSLALGANVVTPLQITAAYCTFANGGNRVSSYFIKKITDYQGNIIEEPPPPRPQNAISPQIAYLITSALEDAIQSGTAIRAKRLGRTDLAGKTGTTNDWVDSWYTGYNRDVVANAWVGFDDNRSTKEFGSQAALPMWIYFMEEILKDKPERPVPMPPGLVTVKINPGTGYLAYEGQGGAIDEIFTEDTVPFDSGPANSLIGEGSIIPGFTGDSLF